MYILILKKMKSLQKPYQCDICNKWYVSLQTLQAHQKLHRETRDRNFPCNLCEKSFYTNQLLLQHERTHATKKEHQCDACSGVFASINYLKNHYNAVHSGRKPYNCEECDKSFARKAELENHKRTHTGERPFQCKECDKTFKQRSNLQTHVRTTHKGEKRHKCPECPMSFKRRRLVTYHIYAKHRDEKPLMCDFCEKRFVYPQLFKKHMMRCKLMPKTECYIWTNSANEMYLVNRVGLNYYIVNPDQYSDKLDAKEQQNSPAIQFDSEDANKIIPDYCHDSMVPLQSSNSIQEIVDTNYEPDNTPLLQAISSNDSFALLEPNTNIYETEDQQPNEMFEVIVKNEDGEWYSIHCVKETFCYANETLNINIGDSSDSIGLQLQTAPMQIIDNLNENNNNLFTDGENLQFTISGENQFE